LGVLAIDKSNKRSRGCGDNALLQHEIAVIQGIMESKSKYRKIVQAGIARWVGDFQKGQIEIKTVDDLRKLIEMDLELQKDDL
jgi:hypothetical protein